MGCFDSTCAFSRTRIHYGDSVLWVALDHSANIKDGTYSLMQEYYGSRQKFRFVKLGEYNDYGCIEGHSADEGLEKAKGNWQEYQFLIHESVADGMLHKPLREYTDLEAAAQQLIHIAHQARIQVLGHNLLGAQYFDIEEVRLQQKLLKLTSDILVRKEAQCFVNDDEDDE